MTKINAIAWPEIDLQLAHAFANGRHIARISALQASKATQHLGGAGAIPDPSSPDYADKVIDFVGKYAPNQWNGKPVGFLDLFKSTVPVDIAFPGQTPNPGLVTLLNLEIWHREYGISP